LLELQDSNIKGEIRELTKTIALTVAATKGPVILIVHRLQPENILYLMLLTLSSKLSDAGLRLTPPFCVAAITRILRRKCWFRSC